MKIICLIFGHKWDAPQYSLFLYSVTARIRPFHFCLRCGCDEFLTEKEIKALEDKR